MSDSLKTVGKWLNNLRYISWTGWDFYEISISNAVVDGIVEKTNSEIYSQSTWKKNIFVV